MDEHTSQSTKLFSLCQVEFKEGIQYAEISPSTNYPFQVGEFVEVVHEAGSDVGVLCNIVEEEGSYLEYIEERGLLFFSIMGPASESQRYSLLARIRDEHRCCEVARELAARRRLNLEMAEAEYSWDFKKLTLFYFSEVRVDFRGLLKDLFSVFKVRIWMQKLDLNRNPIHSSFPSSDPNSKVLSDRMLAAMRHSQPKKHSDRDPMWGGFEESLYQQPHASNRMDPTPYYAMDSHLPPHASYMPLPGAPLGRRSHPPPSLPPYAFPPSIYTAQPEHMYHRYDHQKGQSSNRYGQKQKFYDHPASFGSAPSTYPPSLYSSPSHSPPPSANSPYPLPSSLARGEGAGIDQSQPPSESCRPLEEEGRPPLHPVPATVGKNDEVGKRGPSC